MAKESVPSKDRESRKLKDFRNEHRLHFVGEEVKQYHQASFVRGQVITFNYKDKERWVFIVHPEWNSKVHGLDMQHIPRKVLLPLFDVEPALPSEQFYKTYVDKPWVKKWDAYRTYDKNKLSNVKVIIYNTHREPDEQAEIRMEDEPRTPIVPDADIL